MMKTTLTLSALFAACLLATPVTAKEWKTVRFGVDLFGFLLVFVSFSVEEYHDS